jgi:hypothetical protein
MQENFHLFLAHLSTAANCYARFCNLTDLQINLYLEQPIEIQLFATFFQRIK